MSVSFVCETECEVMCLTESQFLQAIGLRIANLFNKSICEQNLWIEQNSQRIQVINTEHIDEREFEHCWLLWSYIDSFIF